MSSDGHLTLTYTSDSIPPNSGCTQKPTTTIVFICPKRGGSRDPHIVEDFDCRYSIEWETEYACSEDILTNDTCVLTKEEADIDVDLRPLTKPAGADHPYSVLFTDSRNTTYKFFLNVCGELGIQCPDESHKFRVPACQTKPSEEGFGRRLGSTDHTVLRYADGELTLTYKGGDVCNHSNFQREMVIRFICNLSADNEGTGHPEFDSERNCSYFFNWETKYACMDHPLDRACRVNVDGKRFDLSGLVKNTDNWLALHENNDQYGTGFYFINVCHDVLSDGPASGCEAGSAICYKENANYRNLGRYEQNPVYNKETNSIQITYTNGDSCGNNKQISSTISFYCKPGDLEGGPSLIHVSDDRCNYIFQWHTAAACILGHYKGTNCKVYDSDAGFNFDLSPLTKQPGEEPYKVQTSQDTTHDYLLNVCGPVTVTMCNNLTIPNPGVCQIPKGGGPGTAYVGGQWTGELLYFDGMINLTYSGGSPYNDVASTPRKTEITFLCDADAGVGKPTFLTEVASDHYYGFEWRTAYACPTSPMECTAVDLKTNQEYDLSGLSSSTANWVVEGSDNTKYYINVCRALNEVRVGTGCDAFASVCRTKIITNSTQEQVNISNLGQVKSGLVVEDVGRLKLQYTSLNTCNNGSALVPYITNIHFICQKGAVVSGPNEPIQDGPCEYTILWNTVHACPLTSDTVVSTETCTLKDPSSGYVFNLRPLIRHGEDVYTVQAADLTYKINICGAVPKCAGVGSGESAAVCQVNKDGSNTTLAMASFTLDFSESGQMTITYDGARMDNGERVNVQINFQCAPDVELGKPEFSEREGNTYMFDFLTSLTCLPMATDCFIQDDHGNQYNLGSLGKNDGWTVLDPVDVKTRYYINVCRPVNNIQGSGCPDGPIGGCQVAANSQSYNLGYIQSKPLARDDGTLTITYRNGDVCHKGTPSEAHRSTRIIFYCSDIEEGPVFESESANCEYVFNWRTPAACKLQTSLGSNCKVIEPRYKYEFDLNPLKKANSDYVVEKDGYKYFINVCGPLKESGHCDINAGVGACQTKPADASFSPVNAGLGNADLHYSSGELTLTYSGGKEKCHGQYERKTIIKFVCDESKNGSEGPLFIEESFNCQYVFEWATRHACPPFKAGSCFVQNGDDLYDLSSLKLLNDNYDYYDSNEQKRYVINVCRSLIHQKDATCPYNAAACMVDLTKSESDTDRYKNIGEVNEDQVQFENGYLLLVYNNGDICNDGVGKMTTRIVFKCDARARDTSPTGHFLAGPCDHRFIWSSADACPLKSPSTPKPASGPVNATSCVVTNIESGTQFDLSSLTLKTAGGYKVTDSQGHQIEFNICAPVVKSSCVTAGPYVGSCQSEVAGQKRTYNAGNIVSAPWYDDGTVVINMTGGDRCHNNQYERNTIVTFVCNDHRGIGRPIFIDETEDCTYYISWHTDLVCEQQTKCTVATDDYHTLDLSPLSSQTDSIVQSEQEDYLFYLSVCKPLVPISGVLCPPGSGACLIKPHDGAQHTSLGKPKSAPTFDKLTRKVTLVYTNGSQCDTDPSKNFTTRIIFSCQPGPIKREPVFVKKMGCEFLFNWDTYVVCYDTQPVAPSNKCGYSDSNTGDFLDLSMLQNKPKTVKDFSNNVYNIRLCANLTSPDNCMGSMVCRNDGVSFGHPSQYTVIKEEGGFKMTYALGDKCQNGSTAQSRILFKCKQDAKEGDPTFLTGIGCNILFLWETSIVCPKIENPCRIIIDRQLYDLSPLTRDQGAWSTTDSKGNVYWLNVCAPLTSNVTSCGTNMAACRKSSSQIDALGSVMNQVPIHRNATSKAIVLEYQNGENACSHNQRRTYNQWATTRINFLCGETFDGPVFVESSENEEQCLFEFNWKTKLACVVKTETLTVTNGIVQDKHTGGVFDLTSIFNKMYEYNETMEGGEKNVFRVQLNGSQSDCGAVCLVKGNNRTVLGTFSSAVYSVYDDNLKIHYNSSVKCPGVISHFNVSSDIEFDCSRKDEGPKLLYSSSNCFYVFSWKTPLACTNVSVINPSPGGGTPAGGGNSPSDSANQNAGTKGGMSSKTIGTIVGVFLTAIVLCVLVVVFHREERRVACLNVVKRLYGRRSGSEYAQLPTDVTDDLTGASETITITDAAETETAREHESLVNVTTMPTSYHDDSDEDLLA